MLIQSYNPAFLPETARFLAAQRRAEASLEPDLWLPGDLERRIEQWLGLLSGEPDEVVWLAREGGEGGRLVGVLGARAKSLGPNDVRRSYLPPHYGLLPVVTMGVDVGRWAEVLPALWERIVPWLSRQGVTHPQAWVNRVNGEAMATWESLGFEELMENAILPVIKPMPLPDFPGLRVRTATGRDLERLLPLLIEELEIHANLPGGYWMPIGADTPRLARREIESFLGSGADFIYMLAEREGQVLGYMSATVAPSVPDNPNSLFMPYRRGVLQVASVTQAARGQGVGWALLAHLLAWFARQGSTSVSLSYDLRNTLSGPFWRKHGFQPLRRAFGIIL